jgi:hypothetical protein
MVPLKKLFGKVAHVEPILRISKNPAVVKSEFGVVLLIDTRWPFKYKVKVELL